MGDQLSLFRQQVSEQNLQQELAPIAIAKDVAVNALSELVPEDALLALNRHYSINANHVSRILRLAFERKLQGGAITRDEISQELSISWARIQGIINVMRRAELLYPKNAPTPFGELVATTVPYLDDPGLLWLLHYFLASDARLVLWSHLFDVQLSNGEITVAQATEAYKVLEGRWSEKTLKEKVPNEIGGIFRTYTEDLFARLGLITRTDLGVYHFDNNVAPIPSLVWLSAILAYRDRYYNRASSLEIPLIVDAHFSPGRIFRQNEGVTRRALDELHKADLLAVETRGGLDQVRFKRDTTWLSAIARHLAGEKAI